VVQRERIKDDICIMHIHVMPLDRERAMIKMVCISFNLLKKYVYNIYVWKRILISRATHRHSNSREEKVFRCQIGNQNL
jgi:hypothetical protein